jgi:hypothetical protein
MTAIVGNVLSSRCITPARSGPVVPPEGPVTGFTTGAVVVAIEIFPQVGAQLRSRWAHAELNSKRYSWHLPRTAQYQMQLSANGAQSNQEDLMKEMQPDWWRRTRIASPLNAKRTIGD